MAALAAKNADDARKLDAVNKNVGADVGAGSALAGTPDVDALLIVTFRLAKPDLSD